MQEKHTGAGRGGSCLESQQEDLEFEEQDPVSKKKKKPNNKDWGCSSVVACLPSICKALGSISSSERERERERERKSNV
jgi:hypothetical protein